MHKINMGRRKHFPFLGAKSHQGQCRAKPPRPVVLARAPQITPHGVKSLIEGHLENGGAMHYDPLALLPVLACSAGHSQDWMGTYSKSILASLEPK